MLPKVDTPVYKTTLPATEKEVKFRPFLVKEEKTLLIAAESGDSDEITRAIQQLLSSCVVSPENFDVDDLPIVDTEWLLVRVRAESKGEGAQFQFRCNNLVPDKDSESEYKECGTTNEITVDLSKAEVDWDENHSKIIEITNNIGVEMKYPTTKMSYEMIDWQDTVDNQFRVIAKCIDSVFQGEEVYTDFTEDEAVEFLESLTETQFEKIFNFFNTLPRLKLDFQFVCKECGYKEDVTIEGIENFFG